MGSDWRHWRFVAAPFCTPDDDASLPCEASASRDRKRGLGQLSGVVNSEDPEWLGAGVLESRASRREIVSCIPWEGGDRVV